MEKSLIPEHPQRKDNLSCSFSFGLVHWPQHRVFLWGGPGTKAGTWLQSVAMDGSEGHFEGRSKVRGCQPAKPGAPVGSSTHGHNLWGLSENGDKGVGGKY